MRDIRDDLHERANILAGQITLAQGQFDKLIEQLKTFVAAVTAAVAATACIALMLGAI